MLIEDMAILDKDKLACRSKLQLAISIKSCDFNERFQWALENSMALEYTLDSRNANIVKGQIEQAINANMPLRYHGLFPSYDIGHSYDRRAQAAIKMHLQALDNIYEVGGREVTFHIRGKDPVHFNVARALKNLSLIVDYGKSLGITVCLENLKYGPTSNPQTLASWAQQVGAGITWDVGHMLSSKVFQKGDYSEEDYIRFFKSNLCEAHIYGYEAERHYPFSNVDDITSVLDSLIHNRCYWWTIELENLEDVEYTKKAILEYLYS